MIYSTKWVHMLQMPWLYSSLALDLASAFCFLLFQDIKFPPTNTRYSKVDHLPMGEINYFSMSSIFINETFAWSTFDAFKNLRTPTTTLTTKEMFERDSSICQPTSYISSSQIEALHDRVEVCHLDPWGIIWFDIQ